MAGPRPRAASIVRHRHPDDLAPGLLQRGGSAATVAATSSVWRVAHGLDAHRRAAAHGHARPPSICLCSSRIPLSACTSLPHIAGTLPPAIQRQQQDKARQVDVALDISPVSACLNSSMHTALTTRKKILSAVQRRQGQQIHHRQVHGDQRREIGDALRRGQQAVLVICLRVSWPRCPRP